MRRHACALLEEVYEYIVRHDGSREAAHVLNRIEKAFSSLAELPLRGTYPNELPAPGIRDYRVVFFKRYRIIYRVAENEVYV